MSWCLQFATKVNGVPVCSRPCNSNRHVSVHPRPTHRGAPMRSPHTAAVAAALTLGALLTACSSGTTSSSNGAAQLQAGAELSRRPSVATAMSGIPAAAAAPACRSGSRSRTGCSGGLPIPQGRRRPPPRKRRRRPPQPQRRPPRRARPTRRRTSESPTRHWPAGVISYIAEETVKVDDVGKAVSSIEASVAGAGGMVVANLRAKRRRRRGHGQHGPEGPARRVQLAAGPGSRPSSARSASAPSPVTTADRARWSTWPDRWTAAARASTGYGPPHDPGQEPARRGHAGRASWPTGSPELEALLAKQQKLAQGKTSPPSRCTCRAGAPGSRPRHRAPQRGDRVHRRAGRWLGGVHRSRGRHRHRARRDVALRAAARGARPASVWFVLRRLRRANAPRAS